MLFIINSPVILAGDIGTTLHSINALVTINGNISESDAGRGLSSTGNGLTLNGRNSFSGGLRFGAGTLVLGDDNARGGRQPRLRRP